MSIKKQKLSLEAEIELHVEKNNAELQTKNLRLVRQKKYILFLGDSITRQYYENVNSKLETYNIVSHIPRKWVSQQNKQMRFIRRNLQKRKHNGPIMKMDAVHFNFGLHSIKLPNKGHDPNFQRAHPSCFAVYKTELEKEIRLLRRIGVPTILFSNTTPNPRKAGMRNDEDVKILNEIAFEVMEEYDVPYNDLYAYVKNTENYPLLYRHPRRENNCHFNVKGNEHLSKNICDFVIKNI